MKVLFIGNSHTFVHYVPARFQQFCADHGEAVDVTMLTHPGVGLDWHLKQSQTYFNLLYGNFDAVVMQHNAHPFPGKASVLEGVEAICSMTPARTKKYLYMTWSEKKNPEGQAIMTEAYEEAAEKFGATVCPVGRLWWPLMAAHPCEEFYFPDGEHTSVLGASLAAVVIGRTILGLPTENAERCYEEAQALVPMQLDPRMPVMFWENGKACFKGSRYIIEMGVGEGGMLGFSLIPNK